MLAATVLAIFIVPVLYVIVQRWTERSTASVAGAAPALPGGNQ
jgi:hypothetical protein